MKEIIKKLNKITENLRIFSKEMNKVANNLKKPETKKRLKINEFQNN
jgi:hypothetical protein